MFRVNDKVTTPLGILEDAEPMTIVSTPTMMVRVFDPETESIRWMPVDILVQVEE